MILVLLVFVLACGPLTWYMCEEHRPTSSYEIDHVLWCAWLSFASLIITLVLIPKVAPKCIKANLFGRDINKNGKQKV